MAITAINVVRYLLKGSALAALLLARSLPGAPLAGQSPLRFTFSPEQIDGETKLWQFAQGPDGQIIAGGERVGYYQGGKWFFLEGLRKPAIRSLAVTGNTLWIASLNEISSVSLPLGPHSMPRPLAIPSLKSAGDFWQLAKSGEHLVAVTTAEAWLIDPRTLDAKRTGLPSRYRLNLVRFEGHDIVAQPGAGLWEIKDGKLVPFENPLPPRTGEPGSTGLPDTFWLWADDRTVVTSLAVYRKGNAGYRKVMDFRALNQELIPTITIWENSIVLATHKKGLIFLDPDTGASTQVGPSMPMLSCTTSFVDAADRLWVGTSQGIVLFESSRHGHLVTPAQNPVSALRHAGLFINYDDHATHHHADGTETRVDRVFALTSTRHGLALGFWGKVRVGEKEFQTPGNLVDHVLELPGDNLLAAAGEKLYLLDYATGQVKLLTQIEANFSGLALTHDSVWAATFDQGLYRSSLSLPLAFAKVAEVPGSHATALATVGDTLVLASANRVLHGPAFKPVERTAGIRRPRLATGDGIVWLTAEQGGMQRVGKIKQDNDTLTWEIVEAKGLPLLSEVHHFSAHDGMLTFCGDASILELTARELKPTYRLSAPPLAFVSGDARTGKMSVSSTPLGKLPAEANHLTFTGSPPFDEFGEKPGFERRLLPTETGWTPTKRDEAVAYSSLAARTYSLEVRATHLGQTGAAATYAFSVLPPWYASPHAIAVYSLLVLLVSFLVYRLRTRQIRRRNQELEALIQARTQDLARASAAKTEFLASMSHEIRNPMNGVVGLVNVLRDQSGANPRQMHTLKMLFHCAEQLRSTVDDILDFSKIEAGQVAMENVSFNLLDTLQAAMATIDPVGSSITFLEQPPPGLVLQGDASKLRQIFANYLSNALKYGVPPVARVSTILTPATAGMQLTLSVISSGPTIDKDTLDKFFDSFTRGEEAKERNIRGTGLGLAICRRYARAMGGEVGAVSTNGETTFYLTVPFALISTEAVVPEPPAPLASLPARALAIEDEDYNRIVLGSILAKMNYSVDWATTGQEALALARENGYDIILTDYRLPDTNGVDLTREILQLCPDPKPAVFAVTAYSTRERRAECMAAGMSGFISKPITLEKLRATLAGWGEKNLAKISLEAFRPPPHARQPGAIEEAWGELLRTIQVDPKRAADLAHRLNNLCRSHYSFDLAEQLELLEGALERGEPTAKLVQAIERFLRPSAVAG